MSLIISQEILLRSHPSITQYLMFWVKIRRVWHFWISLWHWYYRWWMNLWSHTAGCKHSPKTMIKAHSSSLVLRFHTAHCFFYIACEFFFPLGVLHIKKEWLKWKQSTGWDILIFLSQYGLRLQQFWMTPDDMRFIWSDLTKLPPEPSKKLHYCFHSWVVLLVLAVVECN